VSGLPLVFVHGVSTRESDQYQERVAARDALFRQVAFKHLPHHEKITILNPYWGKYGARFSFNSASLPATGTYEAFGTALEDLAELATTTAGVNATENTLILTTAREGSLEEAIDALWAAAALTGPDDPTVLAGSSERALLYSRSNPTPDWLAKSKNDDEFVDYLTAAIEEQENGHESFGISDVLNSLKAGITKLKDAVAGKLVNPIAKAVRPWIHEHVAIFVGDIFRYLALRDGKNPPGEIITTVSDAFKKADQLRSADDQQLIIVGHSMGGNISYDILTNYLPNLQVDVFVTVGSQVGLFEEFKLFKKSDETIIGKQQVNAPPNVKKWINVFDEADILGYSIQRIFKNTKDFSFDNETHAFAAHGQYFYRPRFHERLNARLQ
jgi:hypothetical protein